MLDRDHQAEAEAVALALAALPIAERAARLLEAGVEFEDEIEGRYPGLTHKQVVEQSRDFTARILQRVRQIDQASGGAPAGRA